MLSIVELDFGTPKSASKQAVTLSIDGRDVTVPAGTSVLRAASEAGVEQFGRAQLRNLDARLARRAQH